MAQSTWTLLIISLIIWMIPKSTSNLLLGSLCSNESFANRSQYHNNRNTLFEYLTTNATTNQDGFYTTSIGSTSNETVFGVFLCRGDQNTTSCHECVANATSFLANIKCPNGKWGIQWNDLCMVRYTNESILGKMSRFPRNLIVNEQNITGDATHFMDAVGNMMKEVAVEAMKGGPSKKFATGVVRYSSSQTLYGYAQCTPDLTPADCNECLTSAIAVLRIGIGARTLSPSCRVRYEIFPFFDGATTLNPPEGMR